MLTRHLTAVLALLALPATSRAQANAEPRFTWRYELLAADRAASDTALASGLAAAVGRAGAPDIVLLYPGAPVIAGRDAATQMLAAQDALRALRLRWVPLSAEVSVDGTFGVSYGVTAIVNPPGAAGPALRFAKYLSAWRRGPDGWRLVAHSLVGLLPATVYTPPPGFRAGPLTPIPASGPVADFARADLDFAALAGRDGASPAFATFASVEGVVFPPTGDLVRGPEAIRRLMVERTPSTWRWAPVTGGAAASGDIGFTVGEATITPQDGAPAYTKYLTLWRRESDGSLRFLADGGNARPSP